MRVAKIDNNANQIRKQTLKSAGAGAAITGSLLAASQTYYWIANRDLMLQTVKNYGGKAPYFKNFLAGAVYMIGLSAFLSGMVSLLSEKIHSTIPKSSK